MNFITNCHDDELEHPDHSAISAQAPSGISLPECMASHVWLSVGKAIEANLARIEACGKNLANCMYCIMLVMCSLLSKQHVDAWASLQAAGHMVVPPKPACIAGGQSNFWLDQL